ncbi:uncharacterized protein METZ01_LOCUS367014, partial [marine metagenome]
MEDHIFYQKPKETNKMKKMLTMIFFILPFMLWAQSITVTGTVKDAGGEVLAGANVVVEGTS